MEFQCAFTADIGMDYFAATVEPVRKMIASVVHLPTRIVPSDRLPAYSMAKMDIEVENPDKWMEVCSISKRTDFPHKFVSVDKKGQRREHEVVVLEVAIGLDRCVHNWSFAKEAA